MKVENLSFEEALKIFKDGKCEGICPQHWDENNNEKIDDNYYLLLRNELLNINVNKTPSVSLKPEGFLGKWKLVKVKKEKHSIIIEDVKWSRNGFSNPNSLNIFSILNFRWKNLNNKPKMKMTLEWEE